MSLAAAVAAVVDGANHGEVGAGGAAERVTAVGFDGPKAERERVGERGGRHMKAPIRRC